MGYFAYNKTNDYNQLQNDYQNLQDTNSQLQVTYSQLQNTFDQLQTTYNQLKSSSTNSQIQSQYAQLQTQYNQLNDKYQKLLASIPSTAGLLITEITQNYGVATQAGVTSVTLRNVSNETLHIISLKLYDSNQVLQSSKDLMVSLAQNATTTINQYLHSNNEGVTAQFFLKVETLEGFTQTSDPLPLGR